MNDEDRREYDEYESRVRRMFDPNGDREAEKQQFASDRLQHDDDEYDAEDYDEDEFTEEEQAEEARLQQEEDDRIDREYNEMMLWRDYHQAEEDAEAVAWLAAARKAQAEADAEKARLQQEEEEWNEATLGWRTPQEEAEAEAEAAEWLAQAREHCPPMTAREAFTRAQAEALPTQTSSEVFAEARAEADAEVKTDDWSSRVNWNIGTGTASSNAEWFKQNARGTASGFQ